MVPIRDALLFLVFAAAYMAYSVSLSLQEFVLQA
jgi:hypothetical protein